jgi:hypothetical protein
MLRGILTHWKRLIMAMPVLAVGAILLTVPRLLVTEFLSAVSAGQLEWAYQHTSDSFRSYVPKEEFPTYVSENREYFARKVALTRGAFRMGEDCGDRHGLILEVGICWDVVQDARLIFVWEKSAWKFDCISIP